MLDDSELIGNGVLPGEATVASLTFANRFKLTHDACLPSLLQATKPCALTISR